MLLGAIPASGTTSFTLPFVPQFLMLANITTITALRVTPMGSAPIIDLDAVGMAILRNMRQQSAVTALSEFALGNSVFKEKTCLIEITNGATVSTAYHTSLANETEESLYIQSYKQQVLTGTGTDFTQFSVLALPNSAATDYYMVEFNDGLVQRFEQVELRELLSKFQAVTNDLNDFKIDNLDGWIRKVSVYPTASQIVYVQRWAAPLAVESAN